jgi:transcriptional regulator with XRE-family HTH domain
MSVSETHSLEELVTPIQCRMARAALGLGVRELAALAKAAPGTIARFEAGRTLHHRTVAAIRIALEKAGIEFVGDLGVNLRPGRRPRK